MPRPRVVLASLLVCMLGHVGGSAGQTVGAAMGGIEGFVVDPGGGDVHVLRNEGSIEARTIGVQLIPPAAMSRIDAQAPANCPFSVNARVEIGTDRRAPPVQSG